MFTRSTIIDGKAIAQYFSFQLLFHVLTNCLRKIRANIKLDITKLQAVHPRFLPHLAILQVGNREDSSAYVKMKHRAADEVSFHRKLLFNLHKRLV